jgi:subtilisin family serine protease
MTRVSIDAASPLRRRTLAVVVCGVVVGSAIGARAAFAIGDSHADAPRVLTLDHTQLVVLHEFRTPLFAELALEDLGTPCSADAWSLAGAARLTLATPARDAAALENLASALTGAPGIDFVAPRLVDAQGNGVVIGRELLVAFEPWVGDVLARDLLVHYGDVVATDVAGMADVFRVRCESRSGFEVLAAADLLDALPETRWCEPDAYREVARHHVPNDPLYTAQWALANNGQLGGPGGFDLGAAAAWDVTTGSSSVTVAVLDDGVEATHLDLATAPGADFTGLGGNGAPVGACDVHGTAVAGCIAAGIDNGLGTVGIAPATRVRSLKVVSTGPVCNGQGVFQTSWLLGALDHCVTSGVRITNTSFGCASSLAIAEKYMSSRAAGVLHFASAGNTGGTIGFPASLPYVLAVGALAPDGTRASFSSYGAALDLVAPGVGIWTVDREGAAGYTIDDYAVLDGTSFAAPYAAGVAALVLAVDAGLTVPELEALLTATTLDVGAQGFDDQTGAGLVHASSAVFAAAAPTNAPTISAVDPVSVPVLAPDRAGRIVVTGTGLDATTGVRLGGVTLAAQDVTVVGSGRVEIAYTRLAHLGSLDVELVHGGGSAIVQVDVVEPALPALDLASSWPNGIDRADGLEIVVAAGASDVYYLIGSVVGTPTLVPGIVSAGIGGGDLANIHLLAIGVVDPFAGSNLHLVPVAGLPVGLHVHLQAAVLDGQVPVLPLVPSNVQSGTLVQ